MSTNDNGAYITISRLKQNVKENGGEHARINRQRSSQEDHEKGKGGLEKGGETVSPPFSSPPFPFPFVNNAVNNAFPY